MLYQEWDPILGDPIDGPNKREKEFFIVKKSEDEIKKLCIDE